MSIKHYEVARLKAVHSAIRLYQLNEVDTINLKVGNIRKNNIDHAISKPIADRLPVFQMMSS